MRVVAHKRSSSDSGNANVHSSTRSEVEKTQGSSAYEGIGAEICDIVMNTTAHDVCDGDLQKMDLFVETEVMRCLELIRDGTQSGRFIHTPSITNRAYGSSDTGHSTSPTTFNYSGSKNCTRGSNTTSGKRKRGSYDDDGRESSDVPEDAQASLANLDSQIQTHLNLSCPYRKKNPSRFNVRDHQGCALSSFASYTLLK
jgi:hypothetical protein